MKFLHRAIAAAALLSACARPAPEPKVETTMPTKRILIALTSHAEKGNTGQKTGAYVPEIAHPYDVFTRAGYAVDFASVKGGRVPLDGLDAMDEQSKSFLNDSAVQARLHASTPSSEVDPARYDAVFYAGGHGTMWDFPDDPGFKAVTVRTYERGGIVAAVCHGPAALVNAKLSDGRALVAGKEVSGFTNEEERAVGLAEVVPYLLEDRLVAAGARFSGAPNWQAHVAVSERLITGQNPQSATAVAEAVVTALSKPR
jgi:putative intracellular protease/amidase